MKKITFPIKINDMKKLTLFIFFCGLLLQSMSVKSQNFAFGVKGGLNAAFLSAGDRSRNPLVVAYDQRVAPGAAVFVEFKFSDRFSLQPMIEYSSQGGEKEGLRPFATPDQIAQTYPPGQAPQYVYANFESETQLNYLIIPILAKYAFNVIKAPFRLYADGGPFVGYMLSAYQVTSGQSQFYTDPDGQHIIPGGVQSFNNTTDIKGQLRRFNLGFEINIGLNFKMGRNNVFAEVGGSFGELNIQKFSKDGTNETYANMIQIGYSHWFGK